MTDTTHSVEKSKKFSHAEVMSMNISAQLQAMQQSISTELNTLNASLQESVTQQIAAHGGSSEQKDNMKSSDSRLQMLQLSVVEDLQRMCSNTTSTVEVLNERMTLLEARMTQNVRGSMKLLDDRMTQHISTSKTSRQKQEQMSLDISARLEAMEKSILEAVIN